MARWIFRGAVLASFLAGCQPVPEVPDAALTSCGASELQDLVGQPKSVLQTMRFGQTTRIIEPGMAVTMDYSESRLNIWISADGLIERVSCG